MGSRYFDFKKSFQISIDSLFTAVSMKDLHEEFSMCTTIEKENVYRLFIEVMKALHKNIEEQFESRCEEIEVPGTFDKMEFLMEEQMLDTLNADENFIEHVKDKLSAFKVDMVQHLKTHLQKVEEHNSVLEGQIQSLKKNQNHTDAMNAVEKLRSWNSLLS